MLPPLNQHTTKSFPEESAVISSVKRKKITLSQEQVEFSNGFYILTYKCFGTGYRYN